ncbi:hypothetical protein [Agarivorans sp. QJM3NY_33]|uniref:hypothetical protein n=1 Tax=Agarivorans sp. QJM3NY_33 TaxID=3421432 RepID=UPI003D7C871D
MIAESLSAAFHLAGRKGDRALGSVIYPGVVKAPLGRAWLFSFRCFLGINKPPKNKIFLFISIVYIIFSGFYFCWIGFYFFAMVESYSAYKVLALQIYHLLIADKKYDNICKP